MQIFLKLNLLPFKYILGPNKIKFKTYIKATLVHLEGRQAVEALLTDILL